MTIILFLALPVSVYGQSFEIGYTPVAVEFWGKTNDATTFNMGITIAEAEFTPAVLSLHLRYTRITLHGLRLDNAGNIASGHYRGIFIMPLSLRYNLGRFGFFQRTGIGYFQRSYATKRGKHTNITLEVGTRIPLTDNLHVSLTYSHISNGYRGIENPGLDYLMTSFIIVFD